VDYRENHLQATETAEQALALMVRHGIAPHPLNFEIWFNYVAGHNPDLCRSVDALLAGEEGFGNERAEELHTRFFSDKTESAHLAETAGLLDSQLRHLMAVLSETGGNTKTFGSALQDFTGALHSGDESELRAALSRIATATAEMSQRNSALERQLADSSGEVRQLRDDLDSMRRQAFTDGLTGIANRKMFDQELDRLTAASQADARSLSLLMLDIDHFKRFNDTYGHQVGDQVLKLLAATVKECVKGRDIPARYGGEEFSVILPDTSLGEATILAEQIRTAIGGKKVINKQTHQDLGKITVSIGAGQYVAGETMDALIQRADDALYFAKQTGRNRVASETNVRQRELSASAETG
jgi:diguanylate cyclase